MALLTNFTFKCEKWSDPQSPLTYEFSFGDEQNQTMFAYRIRPSGVNIGITEWLVAGDEANNSTLTVQFTVKDSLGSAATQHINVKVYFSQDRSLNLYWGGGGEGEYSYIYFLPKSLFSNQIQTDQFEKKSVG